MQNLLSWDLTELKRTLKKSVYSKSTTYSAGNVILEEIEGVEVPVFEFNLNYSVPPKLPHVSILLTDQSFILQLEEKTTSAFDNFLKSVIITWLSENSIQTLSEHTSVSKTTIENYIKNKGLISHQDGVDIECFILDNLQNSHEILSRNSRNGQDFFRIGNCKTSEKVGLLP